MTGGLIPRWTRTRRPSDDSIRISQTVIRQVLESKQAQLREVIPADVQATDSLRGIGFFVWTLLDSTEKAIGVIHLDTLHRRKPFKREDLDLLVSVGIQAGMTIENAQVHETVVQLQKLEFDVQLANEVQRAFLPQSPPALAGYGFFDYYHAARLVGGDYYDYVELPDGRTAIIVADVAGKGVSAALVMARVSAEAKFCLATELRVGDAMNRLNDRLCLLHIDRFVTMVILVLDPRTHHVTIVNAGHMPPIWRRADGTVEEPGRNTSSMALGIVPGIEYRETVISLGAGESLTMYTDGVTDATDVNGKISKPNASWATSRTSAAAPRTWGKRSPATCNSSSAATRRRMTSAWSAYPDGVIRRSRHLPSKGCWDRISASCLLSLFRRQGAVEGAARCRRKNVSLEKVAAAEDESVKPRTRFRWMRQHCRICEFWKGCCGSTCVRKSRRARMIRRWRGLRIWFIGRFRQTIGKPGLNSPGRHWRSAPIAPMRMCAWRNWLPRPRMHSQNGSRAWRQARGFWGGESPGQYAGHFWGMLETRPYMRARLGLAQCLWSLRRREQAIGHCRELLRLNPNDNQGVRYVLSSYLCEVGQDDEWRQLLSQYPDDASAEWHFGRALLAYRGEGDTDDSRSLLRAAHEANPFVADYLVGNQTLPADPPGYVALGEDSEAHSYAGAFLPGWRSTPGPPPGCGRRCRSPRLAASAARAGRRGIS